MFINSEQLNRSINPSSVAVVGSRQADNHMWLRNMEAFKGPVYSVQIDPAEIPSIEAMGFKNYVSLQEIPDPVDYIIVAVPRQVVPVVLKDAIAKGVKTAHIWTSGFAESKTPQGIELSNHIVQLALDAGLLIIGPNCMGVFNPEVGLRFGPGQEPRAPGSVTFLSQSGGLAMALTQAAHASGIGVNKGISFGNGVLLDSPRLLEHFGSDPQTQIICAYIEGPHDARHFHRALAEASKHKPVIIWKGGLTAEGRRMASSHSGSLAGSIEIWQALFRQTGAVQADSIEEALDITKAFAHLTPITGDGIGIIGGAGGQSVTMSDSFSKAGLRVPTLSDPTLETLGGFFQLVGGSYFNPMDVGGPNMANIEAIVDLLFMDPNIDIVAVLVGLPGQQRTKEQTLATLEPYIRAREQTGKPFFAMFSTPVPYRNGALLEDLDVGLQGLGIPVFASPERAAHALKKMIDYYRFRESIDSAPTD